MLNLLTILVLVKFFINEYGEFMMKTDGESQSLAVGLVSGRLYRMSNTEKCTVVKATLTVE